MLNLRTPLRCVSRPEPGFCRVVALSRLEPLGKGCLQIRFQVNLFTVWKSNGRRNFNFRPALAAAAIYMYFCYQIPCVGTPEIDMYDTTCDLFWLESSGCRQTPYVLRVCKGVIRHITRNPFEIEVTSAQLNLQSSV